jgi:putative endonuclease
VAVKKGVAAPKSLLKSPSLGELAESFVAQWLRQQGWRILEQRWHCRWGELDLVAYRDFAGESSAGLPSVQQTPLIFVEVKARSRGNWDADGQLAINRQKQAKLWQTAELFLAEHSHLADLPCRFDIALVRSQAQPKRSHSSAHPAMTIEISAQIDQAFNQLGAIQLGESVAIAHHHLTLQHYISAAFEL